MNQEVPYSGQDFLRDLETEWGGKLYFAINPKYQARVSNIKPEIPHRMDEFSRWSFKSKPTAEELKITGNIARDFRKYAISTLPHPDEAKRFVHLLADPFCRAELAEQLEWFLGIPDRQEGEFVTVSTLPFHLEGSESVEGLESIVFNTALTLSSLDHYFVLAKSKARDLGNLLELSDSEREEFVTEFEKGMNRFSIYTKMVDTNQGEELHGMIKVVAGVILSRFYLERKGRGPSLLL